MHVSKLLRQHAWLPYVGFAVDPDLVVVCPVHLAQQRWQQRLDFVAEVGVAADDLLVKVVQHKATNDAARGVHPPRQLVSTQYARHRPLLGDGDLVFDGYGDVFARDHALPVRLIEREIFLDFRAHVHELVVERRETKLVLPVAGHGAHAVWRVQQPHEVDDGRLSATRDALEEEPDLPVVEIRHFVQHPAQQRQRPLDAFCVVPLVGEYAVKGRRGDVRPVVAGSILGNKVTVDKMHRYGRVTLPCDGIVRHEMVLSRLVHTVAKRKYRSVGVQALELHIDTACQVFFNGLGNVLHRRQHAPLVPARLLVYAPVDELPDGALSAPVACPFTLKHELVVAVLSHSAHACLLQSAQHV